MGLQQIFDIQMLRKSIRLFCTIKSNSPYKILDLQQSATQQQIKAKYYELAQKFHPDRNPNFAEKFKSINQAYQMLKDPEKRRELDLQINTKGAPYASKSNYSASEHNYGHTKRKASDYAERQFKMKMNSAFSGKSEYRATNNDMFGSGMGPNGEAQRRKNMRMSQTQRSIKTWLTVAASVFLLFGVVEMVFKWHQFNIQCHKRDAEILKRQKLSRG